MRIRSTDLQLFNELFLYHQSLCIESVLLLMMLCAFHKNLIVGSKQVLDYVFQDPVEKGPDPQHICVIRNAYSYKNYTDPKHDVVLIFYGELKFSCLKRA